MITAGRDRPYSLRENGMGAASKMFGDTFSHIDESMRVIVTNS